MYDHIVTMLPGNLLWHFIFFTTMLGCPLSYLGTRKYNVNPSTPCVSIIEKTSAGWLIKQSRRTVLAASGYLASVY